MNQLRSIKPSSTGCYGTYWTWTNQFNLLYIFWGCLWQYCLSFEIFLILSNLHITINSVHTIGFWVNCCVLIGTHIVGCGQHGCWAKSTPWPPDLCMPTNLWKSRLTSNWCNSCSWEMLKLEIINQSKRLRGPSQIWSILYLNQIVKENHCNAPCTKASLSNNMSPKELHELSIMRQKTLTIVTSPTVVWQTDKSHLFHHPSKPIRIKPIYGQLPLSKATSDAFDTEFTQFTGHG